LLAVIAVLLIATSWLTGVKVNSIFGDFSVDNLSVKDMKLSGFVLILFNAGVDD